MNETPGLTLTLDYTHFTEVGIADDEIEPLVAHASHFHVRGARPRPLQASLANNVIDYGRVWKAMRRCDYPGYVGIEYVWIDWEHCNEVDNFPRRFCCAIFSGSKMASRERASDDGCDSCLANSTSRMEDANMTQVNGMRPIRLLAIVAILFQSSSATAADDEKILKDKVNALVAQLVSPNEAPNGRATSRSIPKGTIATRKNEWRWLTAS